MLPQIIQEHQIKPFKFWFNDSLQDGIHFQNELYYRLRQMPLNQRAQLYQLGCKLSQKGGDVLLTVGDETCSLWANLRNQKVVVSAVSQKLALPTAENLLQ